MPLTKTLALLEPIKNKLIDGSISDEDIKDLLAPNTFSASTQTRSYKKPMDDSNHTELEMMKDFMCVVGPSLSSDVLHQFTERCIKLAPQYGSHTFMRKSAALERVLLAYEMYREPESAEAHFKSQRMQEAFPTENDVNNLKKLLMPNVDFFRDPFKKGDVNVENQSKINQLTALCVKYQNHLEHALSHLNFEDVLLPQEPGDDLTIKKYQLVQLMLDALKENKVSHEQRINNMMQLLTPENKACLKEHRNSSWDARFLECILHIITFGIYSKVSKGSHEFWKTHGEAFYEQAENEANLQQKSI